VTGADGRLDFKQQFASNREKASADAADAASPVFRDFVEFECSVIDESLDGRDDAVVGIADADTAADGAHARLGKAGCQFADCIGWKMQSESIEIITSAVECSRALQTVRALPQLNWLRPARMECW